MAPNTPYTRRALCVNEVRELLDSPALPLTAEQRTTLELFAEEDAVSIPARVIGQALVPKTTSSSKMNPRLGRYQRSLNKTLRAFKDKLVRLYTTSPTGAFYRLYLIIPDDPATRAPALVEEESIRHGLHSCRYLGCVIQECIEDGRCEFARALAAIGKDPEHYDVTTPKEAYVRSQE
jgi:hypothetical protein